MKMSFRWYGDTDPISLQYISQIPNMRSVVSAVYDVKPGEVWPEESIAKMKKQCEDNNLIFDIVIPYEFAMSDEQVVKTIQQKVTEIPGNKYFAVICVDKATM